MNNTMKSVFFACFLSILSLAGCGTDFLYSPNTQTIQEKPPGPDGIIASDGEHMGLVRISWTAVSNAAWYNVYRSTVAEGGAFTLIGSRLTTTGFDDTNAVAYFPYYYKVSWCDSHTNESRFSIADGGYSEAWREPAPTGLSAVTNGTPGSADLSWTAGGAAAVAYIVYQGPTENGPFLILTNTTLASAEVNNLSPGTTTWFRVVSLDAGGQTSLISDPVSVSIPPVTGVTPPSSPSASFNTSQSEIALSWTASPDGLTYTVYRAMSSNGAYTPIRTGESATTWSDTGAEPGIEYWYRITAVTGGGQESLPTASVTGLRTLPDWTSSTFPTASDGTSPSGIIVTWLPIPGASAYAVYRSDTSGGTYTLQADNLTALTWTDTGTAAGSTVYYKIVAIRSDDARGPMGAYDAGFRAHEDGPPAPTGVAGELGGGGLFNPTARTYWDNMGTAGYRVWEANNWHGPWTQVYDGSATEYKDNGYEAGSYYRVACRDGSGRIGPWSDPVEPCAWSTVSGPQGIAASKGTYDGLIQISWDAAFGATKVELYRAPTPSGPWSQIGGNLASDATGYTDSVSEGSRFYKVRAANLLYTAAFGQVVEGYPAPVSLLDPPGGFKAVNKSGGTEVELTWNSVPGASGYILYRSLSENGMYAAVTGTVAGTTFTDSSVTPGTTCYYKILTLNSLGKAGTLSAPCNNSEQLPAPDTAMATDGTRINAVTVLWTPVSGATFYRVFRSRYEDGIYLSVGDPVPTGSTMFEDTTPLPGTAYYRVAAFDAAGIRGLFSPPDAGSARAVPVPNPPTGVTASDGTSTNGVLVSWSPSAETTFYQVARAESADGDYVFVSPPVSNTAWTDSGASARQYYYKVAAFNADGLSGLLSASDSGYKQLTDREFLIAYDTTVARVNSKMTLMHKSGTGALGQEVVYGDVSGQCHYDAHTSGLGGEIFFTYSNYRDFYLTINDRYTINANMSENGTMTGTVNISSPAYNGYVRYELVITSGNASGGYWYVSQDGGPETQIPWFPSPSSK